MEFIDIDVKPLYQEEGEKGINRLIERAGRTCYKSTDRITDDSADIFVGRMIKNEHYAMLEHGTVYLTIPDGTASWLVDAFMSNKYTECRRHDGNTYITTNLRVIVENDIDYRDFLVDKPSEFHPKRLTINFKCSIGVSRETNRHRVNSMAEESTRYINYMREKFDAILKFVNLKYILGKSYDEKVNEKCTDTDLLTLSDIALNRESSELFDNPIFWFIYSFKVAELSYSNLMRLGLQPQQAKRVLPLGLSSELCHTAFIDDWEHFLNLRYFEKTGAVDPEMKAVATKIHEIVEHYKTM